MKFGKLHACGNDFLVVELAPQAPWPDEQLRAWAPRLCNRHIGVGADGVEYLRASGDGSGGAIRLCNADGSFAEISGNGTRCVAAYLARKHGLGPGAELALITDAGTRVCRLGSQPGAHTWEVTQTMGVPTLRAGRVGLPEHGVVVEGGVVNTGNPHFVVFVEDEGFGVGALTWQQVGEAICFHPDFAPGQTNVEFVYVRASAEIAIRIFERGVGPTSSSGTGTCASAAAAMGLRGCARTLAVHAPGGVQRVEWPGGEAEMLLTGPAVLVAEGEAFVE